jgi:abhydrolase domain-containing protein 17
MMKSCFRHNSASDCYQKTDMSIRNIQLKALLLGSFSWFRVVRSALLIYVLVTIAVYFIADGMIFIPQPASYHDTDEIIKIPVTGDESISAVFLEAEQSSAPVIMYIHGNAEDIGYVRPILEDIRSWGFHVFAYDYRGYGTSDGRPSVKNAYDDAYAAFRYLTLEKGVNTEDIILYGRSVGGGSATYLASKHPVGGLVLESSFISAFRVVLPINVFLFDRFPNLKRMKDITCPVLVMHGRQDRIIHFRHGQILYEAAPEKRQSLWVDDAGHNDFYFVAGDQYEKALESFKALVESCRE